MSVRSHFKVLMDTVHTHHVYHVMISSNVSESETLSLKPPKYGAKVPTNANTPYRISFVEIIGKTLLGV